MKKIISTSLGLTIVSLLALLPMVSSAQLGAGVSGVTGADLEIYTEDNLGVDLETGLDFEVDGEVDADLDSSVSSDLDLEVGVNGDTEMETESESRASLRVNAAGVAVISSAEVNSEADLEIFSHNVSVREEGVARLEIDSNETESKVEVVYRHRGRFLGFIPVTVRSTTVVEVGADGTAEVRSRMPWWGFLVANKNYVKADIESRIQNNPTVMVNSQVGASAQTQAQLAEAVIAEIEASSNVGVSVGN